MSIKNLLVTGYSGFVGGHLLTILKEVNDLRLLGRSEVTSGYKHLKANIDSITDYSSILGGVEVVIHIAARVHIMDDTFVNPLEEFRAVNTNGTLNLAKQAVKAGVKRFIFLSSVKVNGESTSASKPFCYSDKPKPEDPYGISKAEAEMELMALGKKTGMEIVIIRPPLVYGEGVKANFESLMKLVGKGLPLPFRSISKNKRSLVSVYNLVDLIKVCIGHPSAANQTFLVSDDNDLSTAEMVALMAKVQGKANLSLPIPVCCFNLAGKVFGKQSVVDRLVGSLQVDIEHTKKTLNWQPPYSVEDGFKLSANRA
ncbi:UDP-glucose 4-epimerase family protein [Pseudoalteromonas viridis]|uniref:SDR family oxidoreductase n=1 Tax=Pseudoalteromonas viridis TaxID=339617 RepID=A0ABX7V5C2_9GAMM|nr:SDR family oxidoreductase [Pseudoalteromonas viridis]QTL36068.1 SDR family oxidoreductase [Pseudoalteromonas viridis]